MQKSESSTLKGVLRSDFCRQKCRRVHMYTFSIYTYHYLFINAHTHHCIYIYMYIHTFTYTLRDGAKVSTTIQPSRTVLRKSLHSHVNSTEEAQQNLRLPPDRSFLLDVSLDGCSGADCLRKVDVGLRVEGALTICIGYYYYYYYYYSCYYYYYYYSCCCCYYYYYYYCYYYDYDLLLTTVTGV